MRVNYDHHSTVDIFGAVTKICKKNWLTALATVYLEVDTRDVCVLLAFKEIKSSNCK